MEKSKPEIIIKTMNLTREIDQKVLVDHISIDVFDGEVLAIVGPSGSGKSSFLRLLNRLDEPSEGTVFFHQQDYKEIPPQELRREIGMLLQDPNLFPGTVEANIRFGPKQRGETLSDEAVETALEQVNLEDFADRNISTLSGGEAQRVALARTLVNTPQVMLLDEPTSALDEKTQQEIERLLQRIIAEHALTAILITHDIAQAERLADRIRKMERGKMTQYKEGNSDADKPV